MLEPRLGRSDLKVSTLGMGCWAIGGPMHDLRYPETNSTGWGRVDDAESIRAIHRALDLGVNFFDTANAYGCGHSERVLGRALQGHRAGVVIATKFGKVIDEEQRLIVDRAADPAYIRGACEDSLRRLGVEIIDLFQFHEADWPLEDVPGILETLEALVEAGKIRWYGWSTDDPERAAAFAAGPHCAAVQHTLNVFSPDERIASLLAVCEAHDLASVNRGPLAMGILTGKFDSGASFPEDDLRHGWDFSSGRFAGFLEKFAAVREALASGGRTPAQGALAWIWARHPRAIPIPGFKTRRQVEENAAAAEFGPLEAERVAEIARILAEFEKVR